MEQTSDWIESINAATGAMSDGLVQLRRHLHRHPEVSGEEFETTSHIARIVEKIGLPLRIADEKRGLTCELLSVEPCALSRLALRADIDALPIHDAKQVEYRSACDGVMHACGHDVHTTLLFGAMSVLKQLSDAGQLPWPIAVRGIFQPAEETAVGARYMIRNRALHDVESIIGIHCDPNRSVGRIGLSPGALTANCDLFTVNFRGRGGHGARPHQTIDPIDAASQWIQAVYRAVPRAFDPQEPTVISVGKLIAGNKANVIPDTALLEGTLRTFNRGARQAALEKIKLVGESITLTTGCEIDFRLGFSAPSVVNDPELTTVMRRAAEQTLGEHSVEPIEQPSMGSEDFSYYLEHLPGAMFRLGTAGEQVGLDPLHSPHFDIDQRAIACGVRLLAATAIEYFSPDRHHSSAP